MLANDSMNAEKEKMLSNGIEAYKKALKTNPNDEDTRYNLSYASRMLKQQQKQNQQKKDDKKKDDKDKKDNKDKKDEKKEQKPDKKQEQQQQKKNAAAKNATPHEGEPKPGDKQQKEQAAAVAARPRDIDRQDAEAVLDSFERVEPTVQKDLARRQAGNRKPRRDW